MIKRILFGLLLIGGKAAEAQISQVQIIDLYSTRVATQDNVNDTSSYTLHIGFKINNVANARKAHFLLGTKNDLNDVLDLAANVISVNQLYALELNGNQFNIKGYDAFIEVVLTPEQYWKIKNIKVYVDDEMNMQTTSLNSRLH